ncbi:MAG: hypothetical protein OJI67_20325, partial [Prosthecobacter sp.]|nr:hypothetical protein [Prosthecobacter sp.]
PRTGAVAISIMGGIGMMSAGLIGSPGLGYAKDRFAAESVPAESASVLIGTKESKWLIFESVKTLDGEKLGAAKASLKSAVEETLAGGIDDPKAALAKLPEEQQKVIHADVAGARKTLKADSFIPASMAVAFLLLLFYFKAIGGYKVVKIDEQTA